MPRDRHPRQVHPPRARPPPRAPSPPPNHVWDDWGDRYLRNDWDDWNRQPQPAPPLPRQSAISPRRRSPAPLDRDRDHRDHMQRRSSGYRDADHYYGAQYGDDNDHDGYYYSDRPRLHHHHHRARARSPTPPPEPRRSRPRGPSPTLPRRHRRSSVPAVVGLDRGEVSSSRRRWQPRRSPSVSWVSSGEIYHDRGYQHDRGVGEPLWRRDGRSRPRFSSSSRPRSQQRPPSPPQARRGTDWTRLGISAARSGAAAALNLRSEPGSWMGAKGARVGGAALTRALADTLEPESARKKHGLRHRALKSMGGAAMAHIIARG